MNGQRPAPLPDIKDVFKSARKAFDRGQLDDAVSGCNAILKRNRRFLPALILLSRVQVDQGKLEDAILTLTRAGALYPHDSGLCRAKIKVLRSIHENELPQVPEHQRGRGQPFDVKARRRLFKPMRDLRNNLIRSNTLDQAVEVAISLRNTILSLDDNAPADAPVERLSVLMQASAIRCLGELRATALFPEVAAHPILGDAAIRDDLLAVQLMSMPTQNFVVTMVPAQMLPVTIGHLEALAQTGAMELVLETMAAEPGSANDTPAGRANIQAFMALLSTHVFFAILLPQEHPLYDFQLRLLALLNEASRAPASLDMQPLVLHWKLTLALMSTPLSQTGSLLPLVHMAQRRLAEAPAGAVRNRKHLTDSLAALEATMVFLETGDSKPLAELTYEGHLHESIPAERRFLGSHFALVLRLLAIVTASRARQQIKLPELIPDRVERSNCLRALADLAAGSLAEATGQLADNPLLDLFTELACSSIHTDIATFYNQYLALGEWAETSDDCLPAVEGRTLASMQKELRSTYLAFLAEVPDSFTELRRTLFRTETLPEARPTDDMARLLYLFACCLRIISLNRFAYVVLERLVQWYPDRLDYLLDLASASRCIGRLDRSMAVADAAMRLHAAQADTADPAAPAASVDQLARLASVVALAHLAGRPCTPADKATIIGPVLLALRSAPAHGHGSLMAILARWYWQVEADRERAVRCLSKAVELGAPGNGTTSQLLFFLSEPGLQPAEAVVLLEQFARAHASWVWLPLARYRLKDGDRDALPQALMYLEHALRALPDRDPGTMTTVQLLDAASVWLNIGELHRRMGRHSSGLRSLESCAKLLESLSLRIADASTAPGTTAAVAAAAAAMDDRLTWWLPQPSAAELASKVLGLRIGVALSQAASLREAFQPTEALAALHSVLPDGLRQRVAAGPHAYLPAAALARDFGRGFATVWLASRAESLLVLARDLLASGRCNVTARSCLGPALYSAIAALELDLHRGSAAGEHPPAARATGALPLWKLAADICEVFRSPGLAGLPPATLGQDTHAGAFLSTGPADVPTADQPEPCLLTAELAHFHRLAQLSAMHAGICRWDPGLDEALLSASSRAAALAAEAPAAAAYAGAVFGAYAGVLCRRAQLATSPTAPEACAALHDLASDLFGLSRMQLAELGLAGDVTPTAGAGGVAVVDRCLATAGALLERALAGAMPTGLAPEQTTEYRTLLGLGLVRLVAQLWLTTGVVKAAQYARLPAGAPSSPAPLHLAQAQAAFGQAQALFGEAGDVTGQAHASAYLGALYLLVAVRAVGPAGGLTLASPPVARLLALATEALQHSRVLNHSNPLCWAGLGYLATLAPGTIDIDPVSALLQACILSEHRFPDAARLLGGLVLRRIQGHFARDASMADPDPRYRPNLARALPGSLLTATLHALQRALAAAPVPLPAAASAPAAAVHFSFALLGLVSGCLNEWRGLLEAAATGYHRAAGALALVGPAPGQALAATVAATHLRLFADMGRIMLLLGDAPGAAEHYRLALFGAAGVAPDPAAPLQPPAPELLRIDHIGWLTGLGLAYFRQGLLAESLQAFTSAHALAQLPAILASHPNEAFIQSSDAMIALSMVMYAMNPAAPTAPLDNLSLIEQALAASRQGQMADDQRVALLAVWHLARLTLTAMLFETGDIGGARAHLDALIAEAPGGDQHPPSGLLYQVHLQILRAAGPDEVEAFLRREASGQLVPLRSSLDLAALLSHEGRTPAKPLRTVVDILRDTYQPPASVLHQFSVSASEQSSELSATGSGPGASASSISLALPSSSRLHLAGGGGSDSATSDGRHPDTDLDASSDSDTKLTPRRKKNLTTIVGHQQATLMRLSREQHLPLAAGDFLRIGRLLARHALGVASAGAPAPTGATLADVSASIDAASHLLKASLRLAPSNTLTWASLVVAEDARVRVAFVVAKDAAALEDLASANAQLISLATTVIGRLSTDAELPADEVLALRCHCQLVLTEAYIRSFSLAPSGTIAEDTIRAVEVDLAEQLLTLAAGLADATQRLAVVLAARTGVARLQAARGDTEAARGTLHALLVEHGQLPGAADAWLFLVEIYRQLGMISAAEAVANLWKDLQPRQQQQQDPVANAALVRLAALDGIRLKSIRSMKLPGPLAALLRRKPTPQDAAPANQ
ncbi:hypothetical protein H696_05340 [Fonticula alba]|uniref:Uncharacterized protein n=1 Tax=Fonticula alba TaxID=691883 RepID=A0A058Z2D8_FONAL|nr:hypothetical protein H696_05340 [Fonticula alba]KCV68088.1 hypothetical protein H696_05340 [Fonticula alba]|eukprot:XP_009497462.1 hypothetical protein H696_05340 [Fonticula alba]